MKKFISIFTLLAFIVFSFSCYTTKTRRVRTPADWKGGKAKILSVVKTSGELIEFPKDNPGRIIGDKIAGTAVVLSKEVEITQDNIKEVKRDKKGMISEITHKNGKIYHVGTETTRVVRTKDDLTGKEEERIIFFTTYETSESVIIPLSEVKSVKVKNFNYALAFCAVLGATIGLVILVLDAMTRDIAEIFEL